MLQVLTQIFKNFVFHKIKVYLKKYDNKNN